jgi:hypothetical protein
VLFDQFFLRLILSSQPSFLHAAIGPSGSHRCSPEIHRRCKILLRRCSSLPPRHTTSPVSPRAPRLARPSPHAATVRWVKTSSKEPRAVRVLQPRHRGWPGRGAVLGAFPTLTVWHGLARPVVAVGRATQAGRRGRFGQAAMASCRPRHRNLNWPSGPN